MKFDKFLAFSDRELDKLEKIWYKKIKNVDGIIYDYKRKELIKSYIKDIKKIANRSLKRF